MNVNWNSSDPETLWARLEPHCAEQALLAAAGGHNMLLASNDVELNAQFAALVAELLPDLDPDRQKSLLDAHTQAGVGESGAPDPISPRPPFVHVHHLATPANLLGNTHRPGALARAAGGVVYLEDAPRFSSVCRDALRAPMDSGSVKVTTGDATRVWPSADMFVLSMALCPCGAKPCSCGLTQMARYNNTLSGPIMERISVRVTPKLMPECARRAHAGSIEKIRETVARCRDAAAQRSLHSDHHHRLASVSRSPGLTRIQDAMIEGRLSPRAATKLVALSWTVAHLAGHEHPTEFCVVRAHTLSGTLRSHTRQGTSTILEAISAQFKPQPSPQHSTGSIFPSKNLGDRPLGPRV